MAIPPGSRVLELGVGTGLSLEAYPRDADILGIDYSAAMLKRAARKVRKRGLSHVRLAQMDATALELPDNAFDHVMAFHVVTVVPDPAALMREAWRVVRPGGTVVVVNHFRGEERWLDRWEVRHDAFLRRMGWTTMTLDALLATCPFERVAVRRDRPDTLFYAVILRKPDPAPAHTSPQDPSPEVRAPEAATR